ncbi:Short-chain dehydrogenase [Pseudidiomarina planktonica]|uniref:Short-chain dehydrogenase n=1 Tax=Pseudidiomarina planktonica TaxID=1323738 RepID=A0A1Y6ERP7_9GAMM|nr:SDR family oxidoreductase [Pseudidiomarina planktonica]RUO65640.1 short-chain dehydrogenase [Pseudidiomarina planktonica]SMQ63871.1 Short-chain dehydrogenase [Pseudidiomarina planktonica]
MSKKNVVITGANRGIGLAMAKQFSARGDHVIAVCRQASAELLETGAEILDSIDVTREADLLRLQDQLKDRKIDTLINNAGLLHNESLGDIDSATMRAQYEVNAIAPLNVTDTLHGSLKKGSKVIMITSRMGSIADNGSGGRYGYRMSKAALNAAGKSLALDLKDEGIAVAMIHPGFVQTDMVNNAGDISADVAAERIIKRIDELSLKTTGQFKHSNGEDLPW